MIGFNEISMNSAAWLLVFARMGGLLGMNPLFARRNVPAPVRAGLTFLLTALIAPGITVTGLAAENSLELAVGMVGELLVGFCCGYVFQIFYYMLFFAGDLMDTHFGMSMAKVFDPGTSIQMSVSGTFLNILFLHRQPSAPYPYLCRFLPGPSGGSLLFLPGERQVLHRPFCFHLLPGPAAGAALYGGGVCAGAVHGGADEADSPDSHLCHQHPV